MWQDQIQNRDKSERGLITVKRSKIGRRKKLILNAIPQDDWVSATKISEKTGITPQAVGIIISKSLIPVYVERKKEDEKTPGTFIYRRRPVFNEPKKLMG